MKKVPISSDFIHTKDIKSHGNKVSNLIAMSLYFFLFEVLQFSYSFMELFLTLRQRPVKYNHTESCTRYRAAQYAQFGIVE